jgi:hypothetical protein
MALHPGEKGICPMHGEYEERCEVCLAGYQRVVYETKIIPVPALARTEPSIFFSWPNTVSEMRDHLARVDMLKEYLHRAVEAQMSAEDTETQVVQLLRSSFAGVADEVHSTIKRLSGGEQKISDAEVERLMNYAQTGRKGNL